VLAALLVASSLLAGGPVARLVTPETALAAGTFTDPHFRESPVFGGLDGPMAVRFATDGRAFVAEKMGFVMAFDSIADTTPTVVLDLRTEVDDYWDRGLLDIALDPGFLTGRPYLYVYYVYDAPPGVTAPVWNDNCLGSPDGPGATDDGCVVTGKLARYTINLATNVAGSRVELLHDYCAQFPSHSGGGMAFGADGQLYLAGGDGASFDVRDYGQRGGTIPSTTNPYTPINPCGDPVTVTSAPGETPTVDVATSEGGSLRSQDVRTTADPTGLDGALIRINPDTGAASAGNPLAASGDPNTRRIVATGFRNPYRLTRRPGTSELYVGDVGNNNWEEIDRFVPGSGPATVTTIPNYGWPCYEGAGQTDGWPQLGSNLCDNLYAAGAGAVRGPLYTYSHTGLAAPCGISGYMTASVTGLAFYDAAVADQTPYPAKYNGALFLVDYSRDCMAVLLPGANGVPDPSTMEVVGTGLGNPVDITAGPHGDLYYADLHGNAVMRVRYAPEPVAQATATPDVSKAPVTVTLDASASVDADPGEHLVAWRWDLNHDGSFTGPGDKTGEVVSWFINTPGVYPITLQVQSSNGLTGTLELVVDASNAPPVPHISTPDASLHWSVGDAIDFSGSATDTEDGAIPASGLSWTVSILHCGPSDCHEHVIQTLDGVAGGQVSGPDHPYPSKLLLRLDAKDSHGTVRTTSLELQPLVTTLTIASSPTGVPITVGDTPVTSPSQTTLIRGGAMTVSAPATWSSGGGVRYRFGAWSDGNPNRSRDFVVTDPQTATARYVPDAPDSCASARKITTGTWVSERASGYGDQDWFSFTTTSSGRAVVSLGDLPVDARLDLYGSCGTHLATSNASGTHFEELTRSLQAGTYRVRVSVPSDAASMTPYVVRVLRAGTGPVVKSATVTRGSGTFRIVGEVLNASGSTIGPVKVTATLRSSTGNAIKSVSATAFSRRLGGGGVTPFVMSGTTSGFTSVTYSVSPASPHAARTLALVSISFVAHANGTTTETGVVKNTGTLTASPVAAARTWYGRRGQVIGAGWVSTSPSTLAPGASGSFSILRPVLGVIQASRTQLRAN
jgi:glucose/arabinose dehydrogenase